MVEFQPYLCKFEQIYETMDYGKIPPQAIEVENSVLGALLSGRVNMIDIEFLKSEMFYNTANKLIYEAITSLNNQNYPIDTNTVFEELKKKKTVDQVGGAYYLFTLTESPPPTSIEYHALIIYQKWYSRELIRICYETENIIYSETVDIADAKANLDNLLINLEEQDGIGVEDFVTTLSNAKKRLKEIQDIKKKGGLISLPTQLGMLNKMLNGGFHKGELIILAARPAMGKTKMALEFAERMAKESAGAFFSLEMTKSQLIDRMFAKEGASM